MRKIKLILSLALLPTSLAFAQDAKVKPEEVKKEKANETKKEGQKNADEKSLIQVDKKSELNRAPSKKNLASNDVNPVDKNVKRHYEYKGKKFEKVPLVGDLEYFGKNHEEMLRYTQKYWSSRNRTFAAVMQRNNSGKIFSMMDKIFDKYDIPHEMKYLSVIESALNKNALSPVGAYGPWQFMPSTGQLMGLTVSASRDDRADWSRSTHAACKYLTYLYNMFDDWLLVVASYNSGPRPVLNAMKKTGKNDFWSIKKYLPAETQNHVMAFIATATVFEYFPNHAGSGVPAGFDWKSLNKVSKSGDLKKADNNKLKNPLLQKFSKNELAKMSIIKISEPVDLDYLSTFLEHDRYEIERWNYDYIDYLMNYQKGETYLLKIPKDKLDKYLQNRDLIVRESQKRMNNY